MNKKSSTSIYLFLEDITLDGGGERVVVNMANEFVKHYNDVHIVSNFKKNIHINYAINDLVKIHYVHNNISLDDWKSKHFLKVLFKSWFIYKIILSFGFTTKLYKYISKTRNKDDKSIVMFNGYDTAWYKKKDIKLVGVDHSNFPFCKKKSFFYTKIKFPIISFMNRKLDVVTILTDAEIFFWKQLKLPIEVMPNFIPQLPNLEKAPSKREKIILCIGRMNTNQKGIDILINIYSKLAKKYPDWKLHIFGSGVLKVEYTELIENLNMNGYIKVFDFTKEPFIEYSKSSIYAMCSRTEGFGLVLAEAMSYSMAVVSFSNTGPDSIIKNGKSGILVPNGNEELFQEKLKYLIENQDVREELGHKAYNEIKNNYSKEVIITKWISIFDSLMANK